MMERRQTMMLNHIKVIKILQNPSKEKCYVCSESLGEFRHIVMDNDSLYHLLCWNKVIRPQRDDSKTHSYDEMLKPYIKEMICEELSK